MKSPRVNEMVELRGVGSTFGYVTRIISDQEVEVSWTQGFGAVGTVRVHASRHLDRKPHAASHPLVRWAETRRTRLGFVNNLCLGLAVGLVAFDAHKILEATQRLQAPPGPAGTTLLLAILSALFGIVTSVVRLLDFRFTAALHAAGSEDEIRELRKRIRFLDPTTWSLLWFQLGTFALAVGATGWWVWTVLCSR